MSLEALHIAAIQRLDEALRAQASVEPFLFVAQDIQPEWLKTFPPEQLKVGNDLLQEVNADETVDTTHIRAMRLTSKKFGQRTLVVAPLLEPVLSTGLGRAALTAVAHIRSHLDNVDARVDLYLVLVAPPGFDHAATWTDAIRHLERNEHICRTFAWLPSAGSARWPEAIAEFISRTFLARPFEHRAISPQPLDPLRDLLTDELVHTSKPMLSAEQVSAWETILTSAEPGRDSAKKFIEVLEPFKE